MGEAGPEAILPLTRGSNGKLGVANYGNSGSGSTMIVTNHITVQGNSGNKDQNKDLADQVGKALENKMRELVVDEVSKQRRPGNAFNPRNMH